MLHSKNETLIHAALKMASHTDLFITAAYVELKEVLFSPVVTDERLMQMAETILNKLMMASAELKKTT